MVGLQHHDGRCCLAINLLADGIRNRLVCYTITIYPGILHRECSILHRIIQIMLEEPEQLITDLLIVLAISRLRNGDIVQAHHLTRQRRWQEVTILSCLFYRDGPPPSWPSLPRWYLCSSLPGSVQSPRRPHHCAA